MYHGVTWRGYEPGNEQVYVGWSTRADHEAIQTAAAVYESVVAPNVVASPREDGGMRTEPRVDRRIFSTDDLSYPIPIDDTTIDVPATKQWVQSGQFEHLAMLGFGTGNEQKTHKIGEFVDKPQLRLAIAFLARFPSAFAKRA